MIEVTGDIMWLAGYWEADGHCSWSIEVYKSNRDVGITSTDLDVLEIAQEIAGGIGKISEETPRGWGGKPFYRWRMWRKADTIQFVEMILPFVRGERRRQQLESFLEDQSNIKIGWHAHAARTV